MSKIYIYVRSWVEDHETYGEDILCVSTELYPPSKEFKDLDGEVYTARYLEVWENEEYVDFAYRPKAVKYEEDKWDYLSSYKGELDE